MCLLRSFYGQVERTTPTNNKLILFHLLQIFSWSYSEKIHKTAFKKFVDQTYLILKSTNFYEIFWG